MATEVITPLHFPNQSKWNSLDDSTVQIYPCEYSNTRIPFVAVNSPRGYRKRSDIARLPFDEVESSTSRSRGYHSMTRTDSEASQIRDSARSRCSSFASTASQKESRSNIINYLSTPPIRVTLNNGGGSSPSLRRPRTAATVLDYQKSECDRVSQVEHEPTRRHNLESHMPTRKARTPPWQKNMDPPLVPFVVGPGYILQKSKSKFAMTIKEEFFDPVQDDTQKKKGEATERDSLITQLQDQISDLTMYLEEERLNHRQTKQKNEEYMRDKVEELTKLHKDQMRDLAEDHREDMDRQRKEMEADHRQYKTAAEEKIHKLEKSVEFLQASFESFKSSLHRDMDDKWKNREDELAMKLNEEKQASMHELRSKVIQEKNSERIQLQKEHTKAIDSLRKEHKKELDALVRRFSNVAADLERLKKTTAELKETKRELEIVTKSYNETCQQLANTTRTLADTQVRLLSFEEQFEDKVQQVDAKYQKKINDLMTQNVELRRLYVKKCGQLYDEKVNSEMSRVVRVQSAKEVMQAMLRSKQKSDVSFAPGDPEFEDKEAQPKVRPGSAPSTRKEREVAHVSAGQTSHLTDKDDIVPEVPDNIIPEVNSEVEELRRQIMQEIKVPSKEEMLTALKDL
ncbi:hypothetical protein FSP39_017702 [Pinctada imbricata]|uniref:Uncharacterized protein n=1 Tax=Pinctada imbricata TaxID=66713 RepID=A0AA89BUY0_PINIB|nr:hypothetical protein FSP39_017702 [Pinctada imbricata]